MKYKKPFTTNRPQKGKQYFWTALLVFIGFMTISFGLSAPDLQNCKQTDLQFCGCPADKAEIGGRSIILIDATDPIPLAKVSDLKELLEEMILTPSRFFTWMSNGKKSDLVSIYLLNRDPAAGMTPVASFCQLPPVIGRLFSDMSKTQQEESIKVLRENIQDANLLSAKIEASPQSEIIRTLATITSNASSWVNGSNLVVLSDLLENSSTCGFFERSAVPSYQNINDQCARWLDRLKANISSPKTTVAICEIPTKQPKAGLVSFWNDVFFNATGANPIYTCSLKSIRERSSHLGK